MKMGGPAHHVGLLSGRLALDRFETILACGVVQEGEASLEEVASRDAATLVNADGPRGWKALIEERGLA